MLLPLFAWCESSVVGEAVRTSSWLFPVIEAIHLLGLALIGGAILVVDLRLLGLVLPRESSAALVRDAEPWVIGSLLVMVPTGVLLFMSEATKCYYHDAFWVKMTSFVLAVIFTFTVRRSVALAEHRVAPAWGRVVGLVSLALWTGVGVGGRWIGFS